MAAAEAAARLDSVVSQGSLESGGSGGQVCGSVSIVISISISIININNISIFNSNSALQIMGLSINFYFVGYFFSIDPSKFADLRHRGDISYHLIAR